MAYKIQYSPEDTRRYPSVKNGKPVRWQRWLLAAGILMGILWLWRNGIPELLIPGDAEVTVSAAKHMMDNLRQGQSVNQAVSVFCREILNGAGF